MSKNNNNKNYNAQMHSFDPNRMSFNPFSNNLNQNDYQRGPNKNINNFSSQRYTVASPFPSDNMLDLENASSALGFTKHEPIPSIDMIPRNTISNNNDIFSENYKKIKRAPLDEISLNSNNRNLKSKSPINLGNTKSQNNMRNKILNNDNHNNNNFKKNISNKSFNNNNNKLNNSSNINNNIINRLKTNHNFQNQKRDNYANNNNDNIVHNNNKDQNINKNIQIERAILQNQFANRNLAMESMLKKISFFEKLNKIGQKRMKIFEEEFQRDTFFMKRDSFDIVFINQSDIDKYCPLTLIFHFIFNPKNRITQFPYKKSFFESIFQLQGCKNIRINYNQNELKDIPKYFDDFNYINNLFNNFNEKDLNAFINEIEHWKKTFSYELKYAIPLKINEGKEQGVINDVIKVYFASPNDLIVDFHSYHNSLPDYFVSISQYNFHCDIKYDRNKGRFTFRISAIVYNKIQMMKQSIIQSDIKESLINENKVLIVDNIWNQLLNVIREESNKNKIISDTIFKDHIRQTLNKYSKNKPKLNYDEEKNKNKKDNNILKNNNINFNKNNNQIFKKINQKVENQYINDENLEENFQNKGIRNINNKIENKINNNLSENINNINDNEIFNNNLKNNIKNLGNIKDSIKQVNNKNQDNKKNEKEKDKLNKNKINKVKDKTIIDMNEEENPYLFYGVFATFFLFIFKTILSIENGNISMETIFNFIIIIIIGFMLIKNHIIDNDN